MIDMNSKYDILHKNGMFYVLICINNHIRTCIICMLSQFQDMEGLPCILSWHPSLFDFCQCHLPRELFLLLLSLTFFDSYHYTLSVWLLSPHGHSWSPPFNSLSSTSSLLSFSSCLLSSTYLLYFGYRYIVSLLYCELAIPSFGFSPSHCPLKGYIACTCYPISHFFFLWLTLSLFSCLCHFYNLRVNSIIAC